MSSTPFERAASGRLVLGMFAVLGFVVAASFVLEPALWVRLFVFGLVGLLVLCYLVLARVFGKKRPLRELD